MTEIGALKLSNRTRRLLLRARIFTVEALQITSENVLYNIKGMGPITLLEIKNSLFSFVPSDNLTIDSNFEKSDYLESDRQLPGIGRSKDLIKDNHAEKPCYKEYDNVSENVRIELRANRLSPKVVCRDLSLELCFPSEIKEIPIETVIELNKVLNCAIKNNNIYEELLGYFRDLKERDIYILFRRFGPRRKTLDQLAQELKVTRERIRQLELKITINLASAYLNNWLPRTQTAVQIASQLGKEFSYDKWKKRLKTINLLGPKIISSKINSMDGVDTLTLMICVVLLLNRHKVNGFLSLPEEILDNIQNPTISARAIHDFKNLTNSEKHNIRRLVNILGAIHYNNPLIGSISRSKLKEELLLLMGYKELDKGWYSDRAQLVNGEFSKSHVVLNCALKILRVTENVTARDLNYGIRNYLSRFDYRFHSNEVYAIPPVEIIVQVLEFNGFLSINEIFSWPKNNPVVFIVDKIL